MGVRWQHHWRPWPDLLTDRSSSSSVVIDEQFPLVYVPLLGAFLPGVAEGNDVLSIQGNGVAAAGYEMH